MGRLREALAGGEGHWLERIMTPGQRETFNQTQALMSLLEGYSNHVMNAAGARLLPNFTEHPRPVRAARRAPRRLERAIMRLTGLDLKMEQYAAGERFADAVIARARPGLPQPRLDKAQAPDARRDPGAGARMARIEGAAASPGRPGRPRPSSPRRSSALR